VHNYVKREQPRLSLLLALARPQRTPNTRHATIWAGRPRARTRTPARTAGRRAARARRCRARPRAPARRRRWGAPGPAWRSGRTGARRGTGTFRCRPAWAAAAGRAAGPPPARPRPGRLQGGSRAQVQQQVRQRHGRVQARVSAHGKLVARSCPQFPCLSTARPCLAASRPCILLEET